MGWQSHCNQPTVLVNCQLISPSLLTSPIVEIVVRRDDNEIVLAAHQNLLLESPFLAEFVNKFEPSGPVSNYILGEYYSVYQ